VLQDFLSQTRDQVSQNIAKSIGQSNLIENAMSYSALGESKMVRAALIIASGKINEDHRLSSILFGNFMARNRKACMDIISKLENIDFNLKMGRPDTMIFEWGNVFEQKGNGLKGIAEKLQLSAVIHGYFNKSSIHRSKSRKSDYSVIKGALEALMNRLNMHNISYKTEKTSALGLVNSQAIESENQKLGEIGIVNPSISKKMNFDNGTVYGFQLDIELIMAIAKNISSFSPLINFPLIERDLNFVIDEKIADYFYQVNFYYESFEEEFKNKTKFLSK